MAVNLTPQYWEAEGEYKKAKTAEEKLTALKKMWVELPKHKASEKVQAELKTKISAIKDDVETEKAKGKKTGVSYRIPKQGAGQVIVLGPPNAGKSRLLTKLTRATPEVAPYPFTTREPGVGMMDYLDVKLQLIDTPPITVDVYEPYLTGMTRSADAALLMLDLADDDGPFALEAVLERLASVKTILTGTPPEYPDDPTVDYVRTLLVANKGDDPGAADRLAFAQEMFAERLPFRQVSLEAGTGMDELKADIYGLLGVMRIYTKEPGKPADKTAPYTCRIGSTVAEMAGRVHMDFVAGLKTARVWGSAAFDGQTVGREHVLKEGDVVELHL